MKQGDIFKSKKANTIISIVNAEQGPLQCDGDEMLHMPEKTAALEGKEKHVPIISIEGDLVTVEIGSIHHPMEEGHYIELIQLLREDKIIAEARLFPDDEPVAIFFIRGDKTNLRAREYCNLHGLWTS